jgi:hypothetical protein
MKHSEYVCVASADFGVKHSVIHTAEPFAYRYSICAPPRPEKCARSASGENLSAWRFKARLADHY